MTYKTTYAVRWTGRLNRPTHRAVRWLVGVVALTMALWSGITPPASVLAQAAPAWLEPRGVNVVDLVGLAPEAMLKDSLVVYSGSGALAFYDHGERSGSTVTVWVRFVSAQNQLATCLGKPGDSDTWPTVAPAGNLRIFDGKTDVTSKVSSDYSYFPAGLVQPSANTSTRRYPEQNATIRFTSNGAIDLPANLGCRITVNHNGGPLTGKFTFTAPRFVNVQVLGSQTLKFHSYIGPGDAGQLSSLSQQMQDRFNNRHDDLRIEAPDGAEFVWVKYPATPVDPYGDTNTPAGGSYRIRRPNGKLSVDHINSMALPLYSQWQDADQSQGTDFLPWFTDARAVSSPEYFVPVGFSYDPCMTNGGCPDSLLDAIHAAEMDMTVYYLSISRVRGGLHQIPLAQVGPAWQPGDAPFSRSDRKPAQMAKRAGYSAPQLEASTINLPLVIAWQDPEPDNPTNCPCGWFAPDGRMLDYLPPPN